MTAEISSEGLVEMVARAIIERPNTMNPAGTPGSWDHLVARQSGRLTQARADARAALAAVAEAAGGKEALLLGVSEMLVVAEEYPVMDGGTRDILRKLATLLRALAGAAG